MKTVKLTNNKWNDYKVSDYGLKEGCIDYKCLADNVGTKILCNEVEKLFGTLVCGELIEPTPAHGNTRDEDGAEIEFVHYYIITSDGANFLAEYTNETIYYIEPLDMCIWAISHFGTPWEDIETEIKIDTDSITKR